MANQKKVLVMLVTILVLATGVGLSIYTLTKPKAIALHPLLPNAPEYVCAEGCLNLNAPY